MELAPPTAGDLDQRWAKQCMQFRMDQERCRYYTPHGGIERVLDVLRELPVGDKRTYIVIVRAGNWWGKSAFVINLAAYLMGRLPNPWFDEVPYLKQFQMPCKGRFYTTPAAAADTYQEETGKWWPKGRYTAAKAGRLFASDFNFKNGSEANIFTFDQDPLNSESVTLNFAVIDEPLPHKLYRSVKSRFRYGGLILFALTPLAHAAWMHDELETETRMTGPKRDVFVVQGDAEENCIQHGVRGVIDHASFESFWSDQDESELASRKGGGYLHLAGRIYGSFRPGVYADSEGRIVGHEAKALPPYYADCWRKGLFTLKQVVDPHDRKPFAVGWYATFPNGHTWAVAEWPDATMPLFHRIKTWNWGLEAYAKMFAATEEALFKGVAGGRTRADERVMDPNFGRAPKMGMTGTTSVSQELAKLGFHYVFPDDDIAQGHLKVKTLLGDPGAGVTPQLYNLAHCRNHSFGGSHYGYKENSDESKGISEVPELQHKDFPDLWRYGAMHGFRYYKRNAAPLNFWKATVHAGSGYRGA